MASAFPAQMTKAIVLISGGLDSTVALWWVLRKGWEPIPLTFNYYARARAERSAMRRVLRKAGIDRLIEVPLGVLKEVDDLKKFRRIPRSIAHAPEGYIPARNMIFYALAAAFAEVEGADFIVGGHNRGDPDEFPDSCQRFFNRMNDLLRLGLWSYRQKAVKILIPLGRKSKTEVVRLGKKLGAPLEQTWSCWHDGKRPCGRCSSCIEREQALHSVGLDPSCM